MKPVRPDPTVDLSSLALNNHAASVLKAIANRRRVRRGGALLAAGSMLAIACAAASLEPWPEPDPANAPCCAQPPRASIESWPAPDMSADEAVVSAAAGGRRQPRAGADANADGDELETLRNAAAAGDVDSGVQLMQELVDRYESGHHEDDLFEAVVWIDRLRGTDSKARAGVVEQLSRRHCDEKVLRFHWLCAGRQASGRAID